MTDDPCNFCHGGKEVIGSSSGGRLRCPECRGSGLQKDVNNHATLTFRCDRCHETQIVHSSSRSGVLALFQFLESHAKCPEATP